MSAPTLAAPRTRPARRSSSDLNTWLFMRGSGVLLVVLVTGHLWVNLMIGEGIERVDFAFVAGKWTNPFWQVWDLSMLWLAELHGTLGLRTVINDYSTSPRTRFALTALLYLSAFVVLVLGTMTIFVFDPCVAGSELAVCGE